MDILFENVYVSDKRVLREFSGNTPSDPDRSSASSQAF